MIRFQYLISSVFLCVFLVFSLTACGERKKKPGEMVVGNWTQHQNRAYILLIVHPKGNWNSAVRISDATTKIVKSKGDAKGTWYLEEGKILFLVTESTIEETWAKNTTRSFEIMDLDKQVMRLKEENGRIGEWKKTIAKKSQVPESELALVIPLKPLVVNLNKTSSSAKDHYLCLNMKLMLKELMPGQKVPMIHPRTQEAAIVYLSSLTHAEVKDFDQVNLQTEKLVDVLNPYMEGLIKEIEIDHVILSTTIEKVEEFIIENTLGLEKKAEKGGGENQEAEKSSGKKS